MSKRKLWAVYTALFIGSAAFIGFVGAQALGPKTAHAAAKKDSGETDARLVAEAWAGAVETGDTVLACQFADRAVAGCAAQMNGLAQFVAGKGIFKIGPAVKTRGVWAVKAVLVMADGRTQQLTIYVRGNRFLGVGQ